MFFDFATRKCTAPNGLFCYIGYRQTAFYCGFATPTLTQNCLPIRGKARLPGRKQLITKVQAQASRPIELGAALFSNVRSLFMTLFHFLQQSTFVFARSKVRPRASPSISDEMIPSLVAEDGIALRVYLLTR